MERELVIDRRHSRCGRVRQGQPLEGGSGWEISMLDRVTGLVDQHGIRLDQQHDGQRTQRAGKYSTDGFVELDSISYCYSCLLAQQFVRHKQNAEKSGKNRECFICSLRRFFFASQCADWSDGFVQPRDCLYL